MRTEKAVQAQQDLNETPGYQPVCSDLPRLVFVGETFDPRRSYTR